MRRAIVTLMLLAFTVDGRADEASFVNLIEAATAHDARLKAGEHSWEARQANVRATKGFFYPQASFSSSYNKSKHYRRRFGQPDEYFQHRAVINQVIINHKRSHDYSAAKELLLSEQHNLRATEQMVYQEVIQARLNLHAAQSQRQLLEKQLQATAERLDRVERRQSAGIGTYLDVGLIQAELEIIKAELETVAASIDNGRQRLQYLTASEITDLPRLKDGFQFPLLPPLESLRDKIMRRNPDIVSAIHQLAAQRFREKSALAEGKPSMNLSGERGYSEETSNHFTFAVQLSVPLYTGGVITANYRQARAQTRAAQQSLTDLRRQSHNRAGQLYTTAQSIIRQERRLQSTIEVQEVLLERMRRAWLEGVRLIRDVVEIEQRLFDNRQRQRTLYYDYMGILTQLKLLSGDIERPFLRQLDSYFEQDKRRPNGRPIKRQPPGEVSVLSSLQK